MEKCTIPQYSVQRLERSELDPLNGGSRKGMDSFPRNFRYEMNEPHWLACMQPVPPAATLRGDAGIRSWRAGTSALC
jgi:hypothetical protein